MTHIGLYIYIYHIHLSFSSSSSPSSPVPFHPQAMTHLTANKSFSAQIYQKLSSGAESGIEVVTASGARPNLALAHKVALSDSSTLAGKQGASQSKLPPPPFSLLLIKRLFLFEAHIRPLADIFLLSLMFIKEITENKNGWKFHRAFYLSIYIYFWP